MDNQTAPAEPGILPQMDEVYDRLVGAIDRLDMRLTGVLRSSSQPTCDVPGAATSAEDTVWAIRAQVERLVELTGRIAL